MATTNKVEINDYERNSGKRMKLENIMYTVFNERMQSNSKEITLNNYEYSTHIFFRKRMEVSSQCPRSSSSKSKLCL